MLIVELLQKIPTMASPTGQKHSLHSLKHFLHERFHNRKHVLDIHHHHNNKDTEVSSM